MRVVLWILAALLLLAGAMSSIAAKTIMHETFGLVALGFAVIFGALAEILRHLVAVRAALAQAGEPASAHRNP